MEVEPCSYERVDWNKETCRAQQMWTESLNPCCQRPSCPADKAFMFPPGLTSSDNLDMQTSTYLYETFQLVFVE